MFKYNMDLNKRLTTGLLYAKLSIFDSHFYSLIILGTMADVHPLEQRSDVYPPSIQA